MHAFIGGGMQWHAGDDWGGQYLGLRGQCYFINKGVCYTGCSGLYGGGIYSMAMHTSQVCVHGYMGGGGAIQQGGP